jgi:heme A synthase
MENPWLHRYVLLLAACALFLLASGASVTNALMATPPSASAGFFSEPVHRIGGEAMLFLTFVLAGYLRTDPRKWLLTLGWVTFAVLLMDATTGYPGILQLAPRAFGILHACLAQLFLSSLVAIAVFTSRSWQRGPEPVQDQGWPSLRSLSILTPLLVLSQVTLGAALRHRSLSVMPHIISAMIVAFVVLAVGVFVTQQFPDHRSLRPAAIALMGITLAQVFLGIAALTTRMTGEENALPVRLATAAHVATGALTLAASAVLAILVRRHVHAAAGLP